MSCSHRKKVVLVTWVVPRKGRPQIVQEDTYRVLTCASCRAVSFETFNGFAYSRNPYMGRLVTSVAVDPYE